MIIPISISEIRDKELIEWLNEVSKQAGLSRSAYVRMTLNNMRLKIEPLENKQIKPGNSFANKFINTIKK